MNAHSMLGYRLAISPILGIFEVVRSEEICCDGPPRDGDPPSGGFTLGISYNVFATGLLISYGQVTAAVTEAVR